MARPQLISDESILAVASELPRGATTVVYLRQELRRRYGVKAGTDRVYRLLRHDRPMAEALPEVRSDSSSVAQERDEAIRRAELAELREEATQTRTALEIDSLRQALRSVGVDPFSMQPLGSRPFRV